MRVLVSGGGTAGHVVPGIAIAQALVRAGVAPGDVHFVGSERGVERTLVPEAGFEQTLLPGRGIQRRFTLANVGAIWGLVRAQFRAIRLLGKPKPDVVVALGGYASVPCGLAAALRRVPIVVAEQNAVPGLANRLVGRFARACAVSFPDTDLPRAVLTGNPTRDEMLAIDRTADRPDARRRLGVADDAFMVLIYGGSLGARSINQAAQRFVDEWRGASITVRHVIGERDWEQMRAFVPDDDAAVVYEAVRYERDMATCFAATDVIICRAGATSVADLTAVGVPSLLVPLPGAPGDHQTANAASLAGQGGAVSIPDAELTAGRLATEISRLVTDPTGLGAMGRKAAAAGRRDAADRVAELVLDAGGRPQASAVSRTTDESR